MMAGDREVPPRRLLPWLTGLNAFGLLLYVFVLLSIMSGMATWLGDWLVDFYFVGPTVAILSLVLAFMPPRRAPFVWINAAIVIAHIALLWPLVAMRL